MPDVRVAEFHVVQVEQVPMPLDRLLHGYPIGSEETERLRQAFNLALQGLHLVDRNDPICEIVARKVIKIGLDGTRSPQEIAGLAIKRLGPYRQ